MNHLTETHISLFARDPDCFFSTSGRTELGGNHTDHNFGCVLAGSINLDTIAAVHKTEDLTVTFLSEGFKPVKVDLTSLIKIESEKETSNAIVRGMAAAITKRGGQVGGFCANTTSTIIKGSGMSTSAALEVLVGTIFNELYNDGHFTTTELAIMGQEAENNYYGKPCGLMDQIACANGGIVGIDFAEPKNPLITPVNVDFADYGYDLIVVNTGGNHSDLTEDYAAIPSEMKAVAKFFEKPAMRIVSPDDFFSNIRDLRETLGNDRAILRAYHFITENERAREMFNSLKSKDFQTYLKLVKDSGESSFKYLQNIYSSRNTSEQGISLALALTENFLKNEGACRVQGGGFAGTIQAYLPEDMSSSYIKVMEKTFGENSCIKLAIRNNSTCRIE